ncbi:YdcF family protein [Candidatus Saccharibacteria bacterium]|nr:YdcF family protein [Candidatus Saccharibacteria bacterium]
MDLLNVIGFCTYHSPSFIKKGIENYAFSGFATENIQRLTTRYYVKEDCIALVLGGDTSRRERALELYREGVVSHIILSGGIGPHSIDQVTPESNIDYEWLVRHGVPSECITTEVNSKNTVENIVCSLPIIVEKTICHEEPLSVIIVTSDYHLKRSVTIARKILRKARAIDPRYQKVKIRWSAIESPKVNAKTWQSSQKCCATIGKEAIRLFQTRCF